MMYRKFITFILILIASGAFAQQPNGTINSPIYATGYITQVGGTSVTTNILANANHPTNINIYTIGAISGTWFIKLPNPAFEGQVISFMCGSTAGSIVVTSSDGSAIDSGTPVSCVAGTNFAVQFDQRNNIWRSLFVNTITTTNMPAFTGGDCTSASGTVVLNCRTSLMAKVDNNTVLSSLASTYATSVMRLGYTTPGDATPVQYTPSNSACTLNAGAGDGGSQIPTSDGKCWIADSKTEFEPQHFGAKGDNSTADQVAIASWLKVGNALFIPKGTYLIKSTINVTLNRDVSIRSSAGASFVLDNSTGTNFTDMIYIDTAGFNFSADFTGVTFDGKEKTNRLIEIVNSTLGVGSVRPFAIISGGTFQNTRMRLGGSNPTAENIGLVVLGLFDNVNISNIITRNHYRDAGSGTVGAQGTAGLSVSGSTYYPNSINISNIIAANIYPDDNPGTAHYVDSDAIKAFADTSAASLAPTVITVSRVRTEAVVGYSVKIQADKAHVFDVYDKMNMPGTLGGRVPVSMQTGYGSVNNVTIDVRQFTTTPAYDILSTLSTAVSGYTALNRTFGYDSFNIDNVVIYVDPSVPSGTINSIVETDNSDTSMATAPKGANIRNIRMIGGSTKSFVSIGNLGAYTADVLNLSNMRATSITVAFLTKNASAASLLRGTIAGLVNLGSNVPMIRTSIGAVPSSSVGMISDLGGHVGLTRSYLTNYGGGSQASPYLIVGARAPTGAALDGQETLDSAIYSGQIAAGATYTFPVVGNGLYGQYFTITGGFYGSAFVGLSDSQNITTLANIRTLWAPSVSPGVDPGTANKIAVWIGANGAININNRTANPIFLSLWIKG